jgi:mono/diheme cytochrome c family protein
MEGVPTLRKIIISISFIVVVIAVVIGGLLFYVRGHGFSAREEPTWMERVMAQNARKIATPADAKTLRNPRQQQSEEMMSEADEHFVEHCSICHGIDGRGDTTIGRNLYPKVPDMTEPQTQELSDGELYYIIFNGIRLTGMPAWGSEDKPEAIWDLVALIRRLPKLSPEESKRLQVLGGENTANSAKQADEPSKIDGQAKQRPSPRKHTHTHKH